MMKSFAIFATSTIADGSVLTSYVPLDVVQQNEDGSVSQLYVPFDAVQGLIPGESSPPIAVEEEETILQGALYVSQSEDGSVTNLIVPLDAFPEDEDGATSLEWLVEFQELIPDDSQLEVDERNLVGVSTQGTPGVGFVFASLVYSVSSTWSSRRALEEDRSLRGVYIPGTILGYKRALSDAEAENADRSLRGVYIPGTLLGYKRALSDAEAENAEAPIIV